jgi:RNAse (barnase) inhibitor barstar
MDGLQAIQNGQSGLYSLPPAIDIESAHQTADEAGLHFVHIDVAHVQRKADFLHQVQETLQFPTPWGNNWDALLDMLRDLSWLPEGGYVLLFTGMEAFAAHSRMDYGAALEVFDEAAAFWASRRKYPLIVLVTNPA